jgi:lipopolysaccharide transport system ATP-binding protein
MSVAIKIESVSKLYRLGTVGTGTLTHDLNRWWHQIRGKQDPYAKIGQINDRTKRAASDEKQEASSDSAASSPLASRSSSLRASGPDYVWALRDINLEVQQGEVLGIIGRNGAGKSTLLKLLSRVTAPTTGSIKTKGRIASLLEVGTGFHPDLTGRENIYMNGAILGMRRHEITRQLDEIVEFSGCAKYLDTPVKRYSSGMTVRLGFAVAAHLQPDVLIVDEVLAVGDASFQQKCIRRMSDMSGEGRTILLVSHNMASVQSLCCKAVLLDCGTRALR